ncbi:MAG: VRR-NUC domain-containing protein [Rhodobacteraceae bacterium]|nr:VRR-NUC domain-containing protein [Paracoccaceae bacterium]
MRNRRANPEADIQRVIVRDLYRVLMPPFILHHSANEGGKGSAAAQGILKGMGVYAGFSDLLLLGPRRLVLFLEVKTKTGSQSDSQLSFEADVVSFGWPYEIARSSVEAIEAAKRHGFATRIIGGQL